MNYSPEYKEMRVLVAEDNVINQRVVQAMLQVLGINALIVNDGAAAVAEVERAPFDLILTDIHMPVMDGLTAIECIRRLEQSEKRARTPLYVISSTYDEGDLRASVRAGADGHLPKPLPIARLIAAVQDGLRRRQRYTTQREHLAYACTLGAA